MGTKWGGNLGLNMDRHLLYNVVTLDAEGAEEIRGLGTLPY
jgi:hypothetical protein